MAKIISVHSFRGGTGKSNLTANLTVAIAQTGKRVGVIDTDIQSPGIHILFGLDETNLDKCLNDYLWGGCSIDQVAYDLKPMQQVGDGQIALMSGGLYLIPSSLKAGEIARVLREGYKVSLLYDGFRELVKRLKLDYLIIDTHPGLNEETLLSLAISDAMLIILRPDQQDFQGTAVTVDVARKLSVPWMRLLMNKVLPPFDHDAIVQDLEKTYNVPVAGVLPLSHDMVRLGSRGIFSLRFPDHPLTRAMNDIAKQLLALSDS